MSRYQQRGVSSQKEEVHAAIRNVSKGLYPSAFCKIVEDFLGHDPEYCNVMHADGSGTKSSLAYLYYRETGDLSVFKGIAQDALVMNMDDLLCAGIVDNILFSSTIGRNSKYIPGEVIQTIIHANEELIQQFQDFGIRIITTGGETADVGDVVRTLIVDSTVTARVPRNLIVANDRMAPGDIIIGLASDGQTTYEAQYNRGIGSNGLTSARHDMLHQDYVRLYPESFSPEIPEHLAYSGPFHVSDPLEQTPLNIGQALLSPTRTYAPVIKQLLDNHRSQISGIIHCSGGGQTKCLKFGKNILYVKNNLFPVPPLFQTIQRVSETPWKEMYQVFNMGHRMEIIGPESLLPVVCDIAQQFDLKAQQIGYCETATPGYNELRIQSEYGTFHYREHA
ncbi:MAG: phosphoribosylformylglycinamidine cyclo-ligase [SAR324 cluster bacterium]|nr:phosphoribosylformylglycinamidine cyclo-ligase [SAR324 cluster bacterium]